MNVSPEEILLALILLELVLAHLSVFLFVLACFCFIQVLISLRSLAYCGAALLTV